MTTDFVWYPMELYSTYFELKCSEYYLRVSTVVLWLFLDLLFVFEQFILLIFDTWCNSCSTNASVAAMVVSNCPIFCSPCLQ